MVPKVGDVVRLNPDLLKAINKDNRYLKEEAWKEIFVITRIGSFVSNEFIVRIESKNKTYELNVKSNGEFSTLIVINIKESKFLFQLINNKLF